MKNLSVQRCTENSALRWWSLPLSLRSFGQVFAHELRGCEAVVHPSTALDAVDAALLSVADDLREPVPSATTGGVAVGVQVATGLMQAKHATPQGLRLGDVSALLELADGGRVAPCRITLERQPGQALCDIQVPQHHREQVRYRFHRSGDALRAVESLTLGRGLGSDPVSSEQALLGHSDFANGVRRELRVVLENGGARLEAVKDGGRERVCYLESGRGYRGERQTRSRWQVWRESWREERRRFPVNFILFAGLPAFIGFFRAAGVLLRRPRP